MNARHLLIALAAVALPAAAQCAKDGCQQGGCQQGSLTQYVNPYIGTGGHGHVFLGANVPFGLVQLGPTEPTETKDRGWDWCSGYHYSDSVLVGFSHTHLSGTGIGDLGDITVLPVKCCKQRSTIFSHKNETVAPGYYAVKLSEPNVFVELTATQRVGFHRYTFGANVGKPKLLLNIKRGTGWDAYKEGSVRQESPTLVTGMRKSKGWADKQQVFFAAEFSQPVKIEKQWGDTMTVFEAQSAAEPLLLKVAISSVSVENAKENLRAELPGWNFAEAVAAADKAWNDELGKVKICTPCADTRTIFYTALYHTMVAPSVFNDVNGEYYGADQKIHKGDFTPYTTLSLWDTYRAQMPLLTLLHPEKQRDMAQTLYHIYKEQGRLPVWHLWGNETDCMVGNPGVIALGDLAMKGYIEPTLALEAMKTTQMCDDRGLANIKKYGYIPYDKQEDMESVAKGMEFAIADAAVATVAKFAGRNADYKYFLKRSKSYQRYFDKSTGFMRGLSSTGEWRTPFNPFITIHRQDDYCEGNAWHYTWLVPQDVRGLVKLFGGEKPFLQRFDSLFVVTGDLGAAASPDVSGLIGQYAHGNEHSHHILYMYNYLGLPYKAAPMLRRTMREMYRNDFDGLSGNEDVGQMSAWYICSALGLYQVEPASAKFIIGSPLFNKAELAVGEGRTFTIEAKDNSQENIYVQSATLNGKPLTRSYIMYADIMAGGKLTLQMGNQPSAWGTAPKDRP